MRISHILVKQAYEAEDILRLLKQDLAKADKADKAKKATDKAATPIADLQSSFARLATKYSTCPSAKQGGDLGTVKMRSLDPDFADAIQNLQVGELSPVVRTRFGYHLILRGDENHE